MWSQSFTSIWWTMRTCSLLGCGGEMFSALYTPHQDIAYQKDFPMQLWCRPTKNVSNTNSYCLQWLECKKTVRRPEFCPNARLCHSETIMLGRGSLPYSQEHHPSTYTLTCMGWGCIGCGIGGSCSRADVKPNYSQIGTRVFSTQYNRTVLIIPPLVWR